MPTQPKHLEPLTTGAWLTLDEAAAAFRCSRRQLERWRKRGALPAVRSGRHLCVRSTDVAQLIGDTTTLLAPRSVISAIGLLSPLHNYMMLRFVEKNSPTNISTLAQERDVSLSRASRSAASFQEHGWLRSEKVGRERILRWSPDPKMPELARVWKHTKSVWPAVTEFLDALRVFDSFQSYLSLSLIRTKSRTNVSELAKSADMSMSKSSRLVTTLEAAGWVRTWKQGRDRKIAWAPRSFRRNRSDLETLWTVLHQGPDESESLDPKLDELDSEPSTLALSGSRGGISRNMPIADAGAVNEGDAREDDLRSILGNLDRRIGNLEAHPTESSADALVDAMLAGIDRHESARRHKFTEHAKNQKPHQSSGLSGLMKKKRARRQVLGSNKDEFIDTAFLREYRNPVFRFEFRRFKEKYERFMQGAASPHQLEEMASHAAIAMVDAASSFDEDVHGSFDEHCRRAVRHACENYIDNQRHAYSSKSKKWAEVTFVDPNLLDSLSGPPLD